MIRFRCFFGWIFVLLTMSSTFAIAGERLVQKQMTFAKGASLQIEVADTPLARQQGLMGRKKLEKDHGMLFVFQKEDTLSFWMKDTYIALSIGYFDKHKKLIDIVDMKPQALGPIAEQDLRSYKSSRPCLYALEVNRGWFQKNGIRRGDRFTVPGL